MLYNQLHALHHYELLVDMLRHDGSLKTCRRDVIATQMSTAVFVEVLCHIIYILFTSHNL